MAVKKIYSEGRAISGIVGPYFVAMADAGIIPDGWPKMNGGFIPGGGLLTYPDLAGKYLRGGSIAQSGQEGGTKTHSHVGTLDQSSTAGPDSALEHQYADPSPALNLKAGSTSGPLASGSHTHDTDDNKHFHTHGLSVDDFDDDKANLPASRVIDWVGRILSTRELNAFAKGIILAVVGDTVFVPDGWSICDGTGDTPDLMSKFAGQAVTEGEPATHTHAKDFDDDGDSGGDHTHTVNSAQATDVINALAGTDIFALADDAFSSVLVGISGHIHFRGPDNTINGDEQSHLPPYRNVVFIMRTAVQSEPNDLLPKDLFAFYYDGWAGAPATPTGWNQAGASFDGKFLVGWALGTFENYGNTVGADTHQHAFDIAVVAEPAHQHTGVGANIGGSPVESEPGSSPATAYDHGHGLTTTASGDHDHDISAGVTDAENNIPPATALKVIKKPL